MAWKPSYVSTAELRKFARISDNDDDTELDFAIAAASRAVDNHTHRQFGLLDDAEARYYPAEWDRRRKRWIIEIDDLMDDTGLTVNADLDDDGTYDDEIDDYRLEPRNAEAKDRPWTRIMVKPDSEHRPGGNENDLVEVNATFGWSDVPDAVKKATLLQANRFHFRRFSPAGVAGSPETGSEVRLLARLDPDVKVSLSDYIRWWGAV